MSYIIVIIIIIIIIIVFVNMAFKPRIVPGLNIWKVG